jgi:tetratricopeptide (TPR) repeat protein
MRVAPVLFLAAAVVALAPARADDLQAARAALRKGDSTGAAAAVERYLVEKPNDAPGRFLKGVILSEQGHADEAIAVFLALTQDHPELAEPYNNLAVLYAARGEYERARTALEMAIAANPQFATAYENLGDVHSQLAIRAYQQATKLDAANRSARAKLALARDLVKPRAERAAAKDTPAAPAEK